MKWKVLILLLMAIIISNISCSNESVEYSGAIETYIVSDVEEKHGSRGGVWYEVSIRTDNSMSHFTTNERSSFIKGDTIKVLIKTVTITKECKHN